VAFETLNNPIAYGKGHNDNGDYDLTRLGSVKGFFGVVYS